MNLVTPWKDDAFTGEDSQKDFIYKKLTDRGYDVRRYRKEKPSKETIEYSIELLNSLNKNSWVLLLCDNPVILNEVSELTPMLFALNRKKSVANVSNSLLERLFLGFSDDEFTNPSDYVQELNKTCFILHESINDANQRMKQFKGATAEFMRSRNKPGNLYVMTAAFNGKMNDAVKAGILNSVLETFGPTTLSYIQTKARFMFIQTDTKPKSWYKIGGSK